MGVMSRLARVSERLSSLDASFLYMENSATMMHVGAVLTFAPPDSGTVNLEDFTALLGRRLNLVPRYRQKIRDIPGQLGLPVWVDDPDFDLSYHIRRAALPTPGGEAQLWELAGRLIAVPLDRRRPLWELYLIEGLSGGRFAMLSKTHHAMVDGLASMNIATALLDLTPEPRPTPPDGWCPSGEPSGLRLAASAVGALLERPVTALGYTARGLADIAGSRAEVQRTLAGLATAVRLLSQGGAVLGLNATTSRQRRYATASMTVKDHRAVRAAHGGTVNDVALAVVTGALRAWMSSRDQRPHQTATVRAMIPVSMRARSSRPSTLENSLTAPAPEAQTAGNQISAYLVDLPVAEPDPFVRLQQISATMRTHKRSGPPLDLTTLTRLLDSIPPPLHRYGAQLANRYSSRLFNVLITNVPGPPCRLYALGARLLGMYPIVPLSGGQAVSIGITSYNGEVYYGLNADRDASPDIHLLAQALADSLNELMNTSRPATPASHKGRKHVPDRIEVLVT